ncbi:uncharacterized protein MYCFIDRAFT_177620 [Pseudocercospora fijiensis CIRAD86]|uniref:Uncharacterized protein n=1 Tax=Pseudocercospora fijiensis (strain CIRAD86) TaxID=383855 RepID=M2YSJ5_PSEFD|nr:uncharacterized protein MYCFIDRAFT_177620 [Pseudocercospora fijiensis CIRAD86]EME80685.1 hypothetical protein MYCFIDRAFT_177620 [Pseudocercospora fijiensis CIRAD86]
MLSRHFPGTTSTTTQELLSFRPGPIFRRRRATIMPSLLDLSDELLAHICTYAMTYEYPSRPTSASAFTYPNGVISDHLSRKLRALLQPMRSCRKLYKISRHEFLESNIVVLNLSDLRMSACRLEHQPENSQLLYTGNPDPLLAQLVHVELVVSVSDMRAPFSQPFANRGESGVLWRSREDVLSLREEEGNLREMSRLCRSLRSLHVFLKIDEWFLCGRGGMDLTSSPTRELTGLEARYRRHVEAVIEMTSNVPVKAATVSFYHWKGDVVDLDLREKEPGEVIDILLGTASTLPKAGYYWHDRIARVKTTGVTARVEEPKLLRGMSRWPLHSCWQFDERAQTPAESKDIKGVRNHNIIQISLEGADVVGTADLRHRCLPTLYDVESLPLTLLAKSSVIHYMESLVHDVQRPGFADATAPPAWRAGCDLECGRLVLAVRDKQDLIDAEKMKQNMALLADDFLRTSGNPLLMALIVPADSLSILRTGMGDAAETEINDLQAQTMQYLAEYIKVHNGTSNIIIPPEAKKSEILTPLATISDSAKVHDDGPPAGALLNTSRHLV